MRKTLCLIAAFVLACSFAWAGSRINPATGKQDLCVTFKTTDGTVSNLICADMIVPNGSLTYNGNGTYSFTGGGSGDVNWSEGTVLNMDGIDWSTYDNTNVVINWSEGTTLNMDGVNWANYALIDGSNQPFIGDVSITKAEPSLTFTNTTNPSEPTTFSKWDDAGTSHFTISNIVPVIDGGGFGVTTYETQNILDSFPSSLSGYYGELNIGSDFGYTRLKGSVRISSVTQNGFLKSMGADHTVGVDTSTYLTAEADTLASVTGRGANTAVQSNFLSSLTPPYSFSRFDGGTEIGYYDGVNPPDYFRFSYDSISNKLDIESYGAGDGLNSDSSITATSFITSGGTSAQFVKGDGSLDATTYLTAEADTLSTVTTRSPITAIESHFQAPAPSLYVGKAQTVDAVPNVAGGIKFWGGTEPYPGSNSSFVMLQAPAGAGSLGGQQYTLPTAMPGATAFLKSTSGGQWSWDTATYAPILDGVVVVTDTYAVLSTDSVVVGNKTTPFTISLPVAVVGKKFVIKNINTGTITVDGYESDTIDGELTQSVANGNGMVIECISANTWSII